MNQRDNNFAQDHVRFVEEMTMYLRESEAKRWRSLRDALEAEGVEPNDAVIAELFDDGSLQDFGLAVARDGRVFAFVLGYGVGPTIEDRIDNSEISEWRQLTPERARGYQRVINPAITVLNAR